MTAFAIHTLSDLQDLPQWVCFTPSKIPINPLTGEGADCNEPTSWGSYEQACSRWASAKRRYAGIGYEFCKEQCVTGIDLDKCVDEQGTITSWAQAIIDRLNSYTEYSPSGR